MLRRPAALRFSTLLLLNFPLLALLKLLRLLSMFLLHLIQLLLLAALELLLPRLIRPLTFQFLLLLDVPLLHFLALRILPLAHLFKFSLLLLVEPRIDARGVRGPRGRRTVFEGTSVICRRFVDAAFARKSLKCDAREPLPVPETLDEPWFRRGHR